MLECCLLRLKFADVDIRFRKCVAEVDICFFIFLFFFVKRMSISVSGICETDVDIRFVICFGFSVRQMSRSISGICQTNVDIHFVIFFLFFC